MALDSSSPNFTFKMLVFAIVIMVAMPMMVTLFVPTQAVNVDQDELLADYYDFTGSASSTTKENPWVLTGVYTPYQGGTYGYTDDGWLYGERVDDIRPTQYRNTQFAFEIERSANGYYIYKNNTADYVEEKGTGHKQGDLYTSVVMDSAHQSDIFFSKDLKYGQDGNPYTSTNKAPFYYEYTGWRYAFQPVSDTYTVDADHNKIPIVATTTSLSLIWYQYYTANGIAGQLVLSGNDDGVAYLTGDQIVRAFDSNTSTARFNMTFNGGVQMGIYVKVDPWYLSNGYTVQECYNNGWWSIMVTSITTDANAYLGTDFEMNPYKIFETLVDLMTFNYTNYGMSDMMGVLCSFIIVIPLYAGLISMAITSMPVLIFTGILAVIQTIASIFSGWGLF